MTIYDENTPRQQPDPATGGVAPIEPDDLGIGPIGAAEPNSIDEPVPIYVGPDDDPPLGPLTLKEAYGEVLGAALAWNEAAQIASVATSTLAEDAFVDLSGACPAWSFSFVANGAALDLEVVHGQAAPSPDAPEAAGEPFALDDLADSPVLIDRARAAGLDGEQFIVRLARVGGAAPQATVQSVESLRQVVVDAAL